MLLIIWVLTQLSTIFQLYRVGRLIVGGNRTTREATREATYKLYHIMWYRTINL
jgi:hypothetical protein